MTSETLLLRQVNPGWVREGRISSRVFRPTPKDKKRLSVYDGDRITAQDAYRHYTRQFPSSGVVAVSVAECQQQDLPVASDPKPQFSEHAVIDFSAYSRSEIRRKSKILQCAAENRSWMYREDAA